MYLLYNPSSQSLEKYSPRIIWRCKLESKNDDDIIINIIYNTSSGIIILEAENVVGATKFYISIKGKILKKERTSFNINRYVPGPELLHKFTNLRKKIMSYYNYKWGVLNISYDETVGLLIAMINDYTDCKRIVIDVRKKTIIYQSQTSTDIKCPNIFCSTFYKNTFIDQAQI